MKREKSKQVEKGHRRHGLSRHTRRAEVVLVIAVLVVLFHN